jgi:hypothetical protein
MECFTVLDPNAVHWQLHYGTSNKGANDRTSACFHVGRNFCLGKDMKTKTAPTKTPHIVCGEKTSFFLGDKE